MLKFIDNAFGPTANLLFTNKFIVIYLTNHSIISKIEQSHDLIELFCTCKILEVLKLKWGSVFKIPTSRVCFPSLKYLHVDIYWPSYSCFTERLFTICPMLEDMSTNIHLGDHTKPFNLNIPSPALKRLTLLEKEFHANYEYQVMTGAPNLERLTTNGRTLV